MSPVVLQSGGGGTSRPSLSTTSSFRSTFLHPHGEFPLQYFRNTLDIYKNLGNHFRNCFILRSRREWGQTGERSREFNLGESSGEKDWQGWKCQERMEDREILILKCHSVERRMTTPTSSPMSNWASILIVSLNPPNSELVILNNVTTHWFIMIMII